VCAHNAEDGDTISVFEMKTFLLPVRKFKLFAEWMLKDRRKVFKKYDKDKSGTIDFDELENALEEFFDEVREQRIRI
jgi:Ca2+-binding EF-hand superfamily protein